MDRLLALIAFGFLCAFLGILAYKVPSIDLILVVCLTVVLVAFDMVTSSRSKGG